MVKNEPVITYSLVNASVYNNRRIDKIINIKRYDNIMKLLRIAAYVIRFINNLKKRASEKSQRDINELRADELKNAENLRVHSVQTTAFADKLSFLNRKDSKSKPPIRVSQFGLFLSEDGIIRCKGRITNASLPTSSKTLILLPAKHTFVNLLVKQTHYQVKNSGINATLTASREQFWVLRGRETV